MAVVGSVLAVAVGLIGVATWLVPAVVGHGRLIEPPSRSSMWRYGFPTEPNYNDHEIYCGGFARQWQKNGGKCGICGDAWDLPQPRPNEAGGRYGSGMIVRRLAKNGPIRIKVELTANHAGFFEFRLCPHNDPKTTASQRCFDKYLLQRMDGGGARYFPTPGRSEVFSVEYQLPKDLLCTQCILQWRYVAGNNWGMCKNGTGMLGCGPQEEFRACADVAVTGDGPVTTYDEEEGVPEVRPPTPDEGGEEDNEVDSDFNRGGAGADEQVSNPAERLVAIICGFFLTSLVLAAAIALSYLGKKRIKEYVSRWTPPRVASTWSAGKSWFKNKVPALPFLGRGAGGGQGKKAPLPASVSHPGAAIVYGTPAAAINAALEKAPSAPARPVRGGHHHENMRQNFHEQSGVHPQAKHGGGFTAVTLTAPGLSFNPAPPARPTQAPPPPPSRPPRQRSPRRLSDQPRRPPSRGGGGGGEDREDGDGDGGNPPPLPSVPPPMDEPGCITVNGVALPD